MKKKIISCFLMIVISLLSGIVIGGCGTSSIQVQADDIDYSFDFIDRYSYYNGGRFIEIIQDEDTGVQYIINETGSMCPRYNPDGTLYIGGDK